MIVSGSDYGEGICYGIARATVQWVPQTSSDPGNHLTELWKYAGRKELVLPVKGHRMTIGRSHRQASRKIS